MPERHRDHCNLASSQLLVALHHTSRALGSYQGLVAATRRSWAQQNPRAVIGYIKGYRQALDWLYNPANKQAALDLFLRNVPGSTPQSAATAYDVLLHSSTGFEPRAQLNEAGTRTVIALREKYGRPAKKMQPVGAYYEPRYYEAAARELQGEGPRGTGRY